MLRHANRVEGHPDNVAAAIHGGFVMAYGHGEGVAVVAGRVHPDLRAAVVRARRAVETRAARRLLPAAVPHADAAADAGRAALLVHAIAEDPHLLHAGDPGLAAPALPRAGHARGVRADGPAARGGFAAAISGAGPSVVVLGTEADLAGAARSAEPGHPFPAPGNRRTPRTRCEVRRHPGRTVLA